MVFINLYIACPGLQHGVITAPAPWGLPLNHTTMAQHLKHLGYTTRIVGKVVT
jgi:arylsulfatase A-like enzyme